MAANSTFPSDQMPPALVEAIQSGDCVLFVGAGLSAGAGLPGWVGLLNRMLDWCVQNRVNFAGRKGEIERDIRTGRLIEVAQRLRRLMGDEAFQRFLKDLLYGDNVKPTENHQLLTSIPFSSILTTNYDKLLE